jgi:DNA-binding transcriptional LysR family regulator
LTTCAGDDQSQDRQGARPDIGLRHLRVLSLLLEVSSVTRAAQILDTTQSSVSKILAKLRVHFGDPLFVRVGLSLRPTPKAIELAQPLRGLLTASDAMRSSTASFDPGSSTREFSVLVTEVGMIQLVPPLMGHLEKAGQGLRLKAVPLDSRQFGARLEAGEADVALGNPLRLDPDIVLCLPLSKCRIGRADSARGAAEKLYDDAGQPGWLCRTAALDPNPTSQSCLIL